MVPTCASLGVSAENAPSELRNQFPSTAAKGMQRSSHQEKNEEVQLPTSSFFHDMSLLMEAQLADPAVVVTCGIFPVLLVLLLSSHTSLCCGCCQLLCYLRYCASSDRLGHR